jgi:hypothetical protein
MDDGEDSGLTPKGDEEVRGNSGVRKAMRFGGSATFGEFHSFGEFL